MKWSEIEVKAVRKISSAGGVVKTLLIGPDDPSEEGDIDFSNMRMWGSRTSRHSYAISFDTLHPELGYRATVRDQGRGSDTQMDLYQGPSIADAQKACDNHRRGRRNA